MKYYFHIKLDGADEDGAIYSDNFKTKEEAIEALQSELKLNLSLQVVNAEENETIDLPEFKL